MKQRSHGANIKRDVSLIILVDEYNKVLLQHREKNIKRLPDHWAFFGGGIDEGETPKEALEREAMEELNWEVTNPKLTMQQNYKWQQYEGIKYVYIEKCKNKNTLSLLEGDNWGWFKIEETGNLKMAWHDREVLEYIKNKISYEQLR